MMIKYDIFNCQKLNIKVTKSELKNQNLSFYVFVEEFLCRQS